VCEQRNVMAKIVFVAACDLRDLVQLLFMLLCGGLSLILLLALFLVFPLLIPEIALC